MLIQSGGKTRLWITAVVLLAISAGQSKALASDEQLGFIPQPGTPTGIPNFVEPELGCAYAGIGGQAFDQSGQPKSGLVVQIAGQIAGQNVEYYAVTGSSDKFGPGGFLIQLGDSPVATSGELNLKLLNIAGEQLSTEIWIDTFEDCSKNLLLVNLREIFISNPIYLPVVKN